jgi:hypothetical protein
MHPLPLAALLAASLFTNAVQAAQTASAEAVDNTTIQPAGPRTGNNGLAFFNIEGVSKGGFASYGVARFDLSALKGGFDATYGAGGWALDSVVLRLTQANASFTSDGDVDIYFTGMDGSDPLQSGALQYPFAGDFADAVKILGYTFTEVSSGSLEQYALYDAGGANSAGGLALADDILADHRVTLALVDASADVAATYAGHTHFNYAGPTLVVTAAPVPEPETYALMLAGLGLVGWATRRRG